MKEGCKGGRGGGGKGRMKEGCKRGGGEGKGWKEGVKGGGDGGRKRRSEGRKEVREGWWRK